MVQRSSPPAIVSMAPGSNPERPYLSWSLKEFKNLLVGVQIDSKENIFHGHLIRIGFDGQLGIQPVTRSTSGLTVAP